MTKIFLYLPLILFVSCAHTITTPSQNIQNTIIPTTAPAPLYTSVHDTRRVGQDTLVYPALILQNKKKERLLNEFIRKTAYTPYIEFIIKQKRCLANALKKPPAEEEKQTQFCQTFFANISFTTVYASTHYSSFIIHYAEFLNDGIEHRSEMFLNFDLKRENILSLQNLFLPNTHYLSVLTSLAIKESRNLTVTIQKDTSFSLSKEGLILRPSKDVAYTIPWKDISHLLSESAHTIYKK